MSATKTICLLSRSAIPDDPRVRRQGDAFHAAGWKVHAFGLPGARSERPVWMAAQGEEDAADRAGARGGFLNRARLLESLRAGRMGRILRRLRVLPRYLLAAVSHDYALRMPWTFSHTRDIYRSAAEVTADIWLANDWYMLPVAARLAAERGGVVVYDSHEFATQQYEKNLRWRYLQRPIVRATESRYIGQAALVTTVSNGIAEAFKSLYGIEKPLVIRSMPAYKPIPFRATGEKIRVLYHGGVTSIRKLEEMIDSVPLWRPEFSLTIRGPGAPEYLASLEARIRNRGLQQRVTLAPAVPMTALVEEAAAFDVGLFAYGGSSPQKQYVLPNKFFEYIMAGLALCVSDLPEMSALVRQRDLGVLIDGFEPQAIAKAVNTLTPESIDGYRRNTLAAAQDLCWEAEGQRLVAACAAVVGARDAGRAMRA
ncbi:MAG: hypothetical protein Kow00114_31060 [Kiloniellaceae bacterium]